MIYLDSNIFVIASNPDDDRSGIARKIMQVMEEGHIEGITSVLTVDEVVYALGGIAGEEKALKVWNDFSTEPGLELRELDSIDVSRAKKYYPEFDPRDALHLQAFKSSGAHYLITEDNDFLENVESAENTRGFLEEHLDYSNLPGELVEEVEKVL